MSRVKTSCAAYVPQFERCLAHAEGLLKKKYTGHPIKVSVVKGKDTVNDQPVIWIPSDDTRNPYYAVGMLPVRAHVAKFGKSPGIVVVKYPDGHVDDRTLCWEMGRCILWLHGVTDDYAQREEMRRRGFLKLPKA